MLVAAGLVAWLISQCLGWAVGGAGHGWTPPIFFTVPLFVLYPAAVVGAFARGASAFRAGVAMLGVAATLDLWLLSVTLQDGSYFLKMWSFAPCIVCAWLVCWFGWQALGVRMLLAGRNA